MIEYEDWYKLQVEKGCLPDKDGYFHFVQPQKEYYEMLRAFLEECPED